MIGKDQNPDIGKATQFKKGQVANPNGRPKGSKSWAFLVREMLEDEEYTYEIFDKKKKELRNLKYPAKVIVAVMIGKASLGDVKAAKWLKETGYGNNLDITSDGKALPAPIYGGVSIAS